MARTTEVSSKPHASTVCARPSLNPWIVVGLILILIAAFILLEMHMRRGVEGPGCPPQNTQVQELNTTIHGVCLNTRQLSRAPSSAPAAQTTRKALMK